MTPFPAESRGPGEYREGATVMLIATALPYIRVPKRDLRLEPGRLGSGDGDVTEEKTPASFKSHKTWNADVGNATVPTVHTVPCGTWNVDQIVRLGTQYVIV